MSFWCSCDCLHQHKITVALFVGYCQGFYYSQHKLVLLLPLTMQVASTPLSLVSTQVLLISDSSHLVKLLFFQKAVPVVVIVNLACNVVRNEPNGLCMILLQYSKQMPRFPVLPQGIVCIRGTFWELTI